MLGQMPGVHVDVAPNAIDALRLLRMHSASREPYHLLVTDHEMEPMQGLELLVRSSSESPGTMRVMMSARPDVEEEAAVQTLAHAFLAKPVSPSRLKLMVELAREDE